MPSVVTNKLTSEFSDFVCSLFFPDAQGNEVYGSDKVGIFLHLSSDEAFVKSEKAAFSPLIRLVDRCEKESGAIFRVV